MASRSRLLLYLAVAALLIVALLWICRSGQKPFSYPGIVQIGSDCSVRPDTAVVEVGLLSYSRAQVLWHVAGKQENDAVVISGRREARLFPELSVESQAQTREHRPPNSQHVANPFQREYEISGSYDSIRSGVPWTALKDLVRHPKGAVVWKYTVTYIRDGKPLCTRDPEVCVQKWGSTGCLANPTSGG